MFSVVRVDTQNYGFVVGQYDDHATASRHVDRHACILRRQPGYRNAMTELMWEIIDTADAVYPIGTRIRTT